LLSARFQKIHELCDGHDISLNELDVALGEDGAPLLTLLLCVPFLFPVPLPGLSSIFGFAIIFLEMRTFYAVPPPLPGFVGKRRISRILIERMSRRASDAIVRIEHVFFPRLERVTGGIGRRLVSVAIIVSAIGLSLPFPPVIPLTNTIPALAIILLSIGMIFRDGIVAVVGYSVAVFTWIYYVMVGGALFLVLEKIWEWIKPYMNAAFAPS
jgi:hypothetical protein